MRPVPHDTAVLVFGICSLLFVHMAVGFSGNTRQNSQRDSLRSKSGPILPLSRDTTIRLIPRFNPQRDSAGFKFIPRNFGEQQVQVVPNIGLSDFVLYQKPPRVRTTVEPIYPDEALRARLEGSVFVRILVGKEGKAESVSVLKSDAEILNGAAIEAAKHFLFTPAYRDNSPIEAWMTCEIRFRLPKK